MKILLLEDETDLSNILAKGLRRSGYAVDAVYDGEEGLYNYELNEYDLIILDLNLPSMDGLDILRHIRKNDKKTKILILSARTKIEQRVEGLDLGANDYLVKPFDFLELEARIRNLLRISFFQNNSEIECGAIKINTLSKTVFMDNKKIQLTKKEYSIFEYLFIYKDEVISSERLIEHVWDSDVDLFSNSLKYHIHSIKKKLGEAGDYIKNIRGHGYILTEEENEV